jgi:hypothetical protein
MYHGGSPDLPLQTAGRASYCVSSVLDARIVYSMVLAGDGRHCLRANAAFDMDAGMNALSMFTSPSESGQVQRGRRRDNIPAVACAHLDDG